MINDKTMQNLILEEVNQCNEHKKLLFEVFHQRSDVERISSGAQLDFDEHSKFVEEHPYRYWFLIKIEGGYIGAVNISYENSLGIHLFDEYGTFLRKIIEKICDTIRPLPRLASVRPSNFTINISPKNTKLERELESLGANCIQKTFQLGKNEKSSV